MNIFMSTAIKKDHHCSFRTKENSKMTDAVIRGSCLCGRIKFEVTPPFTDFRYCHCPRCQKATGSAHASNIIAPPDRIHWLAGQDNIIRFDLPEAKRFSTSFCMTCGTPLPRISRNGSVLIIPAGSLDDDPVIRPKNSIWWAFRALWYVEPSEIPKFDEMESK
jgi:hypothetical protein